MLSNLINLYHAYFNNTTATSNYDASNPNHDPYTWCLSAGLMALTISLNRYLENATNNNSTQLNTPKQPSIGKGKKNN
jgi:hypothetical protein